MDGRYRNYCFTIFKDIENFEPKVEECKFMIYQLECCPNSGKYHIQGYLELEDKKSKKKCKEILMNDSAHIEVAIGSAGQNIAYCSKKESQADENYYVFGEPKTQGKRNDLDAIVDAIEEGMTTKEILIEFRGNALRHIGMIKKGLQAYHNLDCIDRYILSQREQREPDDIETIVMDSHINALCDAIEPELDLLENYDFGADLTITPNNNFCPEVDGNTETSTFGQDSDITILENEDFTALLKKAEKTSDVYSESKIPPSNRSVTPPSPRNKEYNNKYKLNIKTHLIK